MIEVGGAAGLAGIPPGPVLAGALAGFDLRTVGNDDAVDLLIAQHRQLSHEQARLWAAIDEVLHRQRFTPPHAHVRLHGLDIDGADEVRAALTWTRRAAETESHHAHTLVCELPLVWQALDEGAIDRGKALVFARHLPDLSPEQSAWICEALLPIAPGLTTGQLDERIRRMILEIDPAYYRGRYKKALRERKVVHYLDQDGAAVITATGLPVEEAAAAMARVDRLARAARRAGHRGTLDQIRADTMLALLDGSVHGMSRDEIIRALIARYAGGADIDTDPGPSTTVSTTSSHGPDTSGAAAPDDGPSAGPSGGEVAPSAPTTVPAAITLPLTAGSDQRLGEQRVGVEIRVPLITLLGEAERAGEIPGLGPVTADTARRAVSRARRASWRWAVVDSEGRLLTEGVTRRRPADMERHGPPGGIVELQIAATDLVRLAAEPAACGGWAEVVIDIAEQHRRYDRAVRLAELDDHPAARFPRAGLRRHVQIRDRTCCAPGCRAPATTTDLDHTVEHAHGGTTTHDDLGPACRHDHGLKDRGWHLRQPEPGVFEWTSPLGRTYRVQPEPILPPPVKEVAHEQETWFAQPADDVDRPLMAEPRAERAPPSPAPEEPRRDPFMIIDVEVADDPPSF